MVNVSFANPATIQRYVWIGSNEDGTRVAFIKSHFGTFSHTPYAALIVKEAGNQKNIYSDGAEEISGGEDVLAKLHQKLINRNKEKLKDFGIDLSKEFITEASIAIPRSADPDVTSGWVDIQDAGITDFSVKSYSSDTCPIHNPGLAFDINLNEKRQLTVKPKYDDCGRDGVSVRNVFRTKKALWFVMDVHEMFGVKKADTYWIDIEGIVIN